MTEPKKSTLVAWRRFVSTNEGQEGMLYLRERTPEITKGEQASIVFEAGVTQGYRRALDVFSEFLAAETKADINASND